MEKSVFIRRIEYPNSLTDKEKAIISDGLSGVASSCQKLQLIKIHYF
jgi:hypothetical protein